jgi:hypothetical protein
MRDECIDASTSVSSHIQFHNEGDDEPDFYRMVVVYIV